MSIQSDVTSLSNPGDIQHMTVKEQISDAEYFLEVIKRSDTHEELRPNRGAFLAMSRRIADHLLEDYNLKFDLGITLDVKLSKYTFEEKAKRQFSLLSAVSSGVVKL